MNKEKIYINWQDIQTIIDNSIEKFETKYDCILAIGRGGLIPAVILSHKLNIPIKVLTLSSYGDAEESSGRVIFKQEPSKQEMHNFHHKNILIVDDIVDTGLSLEATIEFIEKSKRVGCMIKNPPYIKPLCVDIFALFSKEEHKDKLINKESVNILQSDNWLVLPWEK